MVVAKKNVTSKVVAKKKAPIKKSNPPKTTKPKTVKTNKQIASLVNQSKEHKLAVWEKTETANELAMKDWGARLVRTKQEMEKLSEIVERITIKLLNQAYSVYSEVIKSDLADEFFSELWNELRREGIKVQSNTPNASLVVRYICGAHVTAKTVSNYAKVLEGADYNNIKPEQFVAWVQHKTMTKVIEDQRSIENHTETRAEKMSRARAVVMRLIEIRETQPLFSWKTTAHSAEKQISEQGLWVGIGNAHRILDGGTNFNASMNLVMMLPLNPEMERHILNIYARELVDAVDYYEEKINGLEESVWVEELWEKLVSAGYEESAKQDEYWSNRQQATMFENQQEFIEKVVIPQKKAMKKKS